MRIGPLSDFTQKELDHPTFTVMDESLPEGLYFVLGSLSVPSECSNIIRSVNGYINADVVKPILVDALRRTYPELVDPTFEYVARNQRQLQ